MDERYEEILSLDKNQWTYGSPILILDGKLEYDTVSERNLLSVRFKNICDIPLNEVQLTVYALDEEGNVCEIKHDYKALHLASMSEFGGNVKLPIENKNAKEFKLKITKIICEKGSIWEKDEIFVANKEIKDPETFGPAMDEEYENNYNTCKELIVKDDSESLKTAVELLNSLLWYKNSDEMIEYAIRKYDIALRTEKRKKRENERKELRKKRNKKIIFGTATLLVVVIAACGILFATVVVPNKKLQQAKDSNKNGQFEKAVKICKELKGYKDSEDVLTESYYQIGFQSYDSQDFETTVKYLSMCPKDYKGSSNLLAQGNYNLGTTAISAKKYDEAISYFNESMKHTQDAAIINHNKAGIANAYFGKGDVEKAWTTIKEVYAADNSEKETYNSYGYAYAAQLQKNGNADGAAEVYKLVKGYKDSAKKYGEIIYNKSVTLAEGGDLKKAVGMLKTVKNDYSKAGKLYTDMNYFVNVTSSWVGTWVMKADKSQTMTVSTVMFKGELCLKVADTYLKYDTIVSGKKRVRQIAIGTERVFYKLKKFHDYKIEFTHKGSELIRTLKYDGGTYKRKYKMKK